MTMARFPSARGETRAGAIRRRRCDRRGTNVSAALAIALITLSGCDGVTVLVPAAPGPTDGAGALPMMYVPSVAGALEPVFTPNGTRDLNDHTLVLGPDGSWHLYGITDSSVGAPFAERSLLHATAPSLYGPWTEGADILTADPSLNESALWAPHVVARDGDYWTMYYAAGVGAEESPQRTLRRADSPDLEHWARAETSPAPADRPPGGRDPMVLWDGTRWILYSVGVDAENHGQIVATTNADLDDPDGWSDLVAVLTDPVPSFVWGNLESPFVVRYEGWWYLFTTRTADNAIDYVRTIVFRSRDPLAFAWRPLTELRAHAAEVVEGADGTWYLTSAGWTSYVGEANRGLLVAPLTWAIVTGDNDDGRSTSIFSGAR